MKPLVIAALFLSLVAVALGLFGVSKPSAAAASQPSELAGLRAEVEALKTTNDALAKQLDALQHQPKLEALESSRLPVGEIDAAVERALAARGVAKPGSEGADKLAGKPPAKLDARAAYALLNDPNVSWEERRKKWSEYAKAGLIDELVGLYEKNAAENPNDTKAQTALGNAYLNKLFNSPQGPEAGVWGTKADKAFDRALTIDDHNWEARYVKAVSLSNWPVFLGKQPEAIKHFEILVGQQEQGPARPEYASTYEILGNMYLSSGQKDKAIGVWQQGFNLFPDSATLAAKLH